MSKFLMSSKKSKEAVEKASARGGYARFKPEKSKSRLLILGPVKEDRSAVFTTCIHQLFKGNNLVAQAASPAFSGEKDKIAEMGWKLKAKYENSTDTKKKDFWRNMIPNRTHFVNVLNLDDIEAGPMVYAMSGAVADEVLSEMKEVGDDLTTICDFDEGRILQIKSNMKPKLKRRYKVQFLESTANLIEDGVLDEVKIADMAGQVHDLETLQPAFSEEAYEEFLAKITKKAAALGISLEGLDSDEEDEEIEEVDDDVLEEEDDFTDDEDEIDEDEIEDIEDEDEFEEEEDPEEEIEEEFEDEEFEEEEEEPEPPKKKKKVAKKTSTSKKKTTKKASSTASKKKRRRRA